MLWGFRCVAHASYDLSIWVYLGPNKVHVRPSTHSNTMAASCTADANSDAGCVCAARLRCRHYLAMRASRCCPRRCVPRALAWSAALVCAVPPLMCHPSRGGGAPPQIAPPEPEIVIFQVRARASACARSNESARHHCRAPPCAAIEPRRRRWVHARRHPCRVRLSWPVCRLYGNLVCRQRTLQSRACQRTLYATTCNWQRICIY